MKHQDVKLLESHRRYDGYFKVDELQLKIPLYRGGISETLRREVLERGQVAAVLLYDPKIRQAVLIEQFRAGAYAVGWDPWLLECVAGIIEPGESAEEVARRESLEEAGCPIKRLIPIAAFLTSPGAVSETCRLFCGLVDAAGSEGYYGLAEEGEDIRSRLYGIDDVRTLLDEGKIVNAKTIVALQWLLMHYDELPVDA